MLSSKRSGGHAAAQQYGNNVNLFSGSGNAKHAAGNNPNSNQQPDYYDTFGAGDINFAAVADDVVEDNLRQAHTPNSGPGFYSDLTSQI